MYSARTSSIILAMIVTGTARSVGVKALYQLGFKHPEIVALLYLIGQSLALVIYISSKLFKEQIHLERGQDVEKFQEHSTAIFNKSDDAFSFRDNEIACDDLSQTPFLQSLISYGSEYKEGDDKHSKKETFLEEVLLTSTKKNKLVLRQGSTTGLTEDSHNAVACIHGIPWYLKPLIPGLFNLGCGILKWASFVFVAASIAEMLTSGLGLIFSVIVARLVRKRRISQQRWLAVLIVAVGLLTVYEADAGNHTSLMVGKSSQWQHDGNLLGLLLIVGQCIMAAVQEMAEELFLQESQFPPMLLLGMEGLYGLLIGIPLYCQYTPETLHLSSLMEALSTTKLTLWEFAAYLLFLTAIFTATAIFNIMATGATSSMTRNMWKNVRTLSVWVVGLLLFYVVGDGAHGIGEQWSVPHSFFVLGGFLIVLSGIYIYYKAEE